MRATPGDDEVLKRVQAASANPADWHMLRADPFLIRLMGGERFTVPVQGNNRPVQPLNDRTVVTDRVGGES